MKTNTGDSSARRPSLLERLFPGVRRKRFLRIWSEHLADHAAVYTGMYTSIKRISEGKARGPERVLQEWCTRTRYQFPDSAAQDSCVCDLLPLCEQGTDEKYREWTALLLQAAASAGIYCDAEGELLLDDHSAMAYIEWDNAAIDSGDRIEVINPAWYHNGVTLEQGHGRRL